MTMVIYLSIIHVVYLIFGHTQRCIQPHRRTPASFRRLTLLEMPIWKNRSFSVSFKGKHKTRYYRLYEIIFITMLYTLRNIITIPSLCIYVNYILQYTWIYILYIYICTIFMYIVYTLYLGLLFGSTFSPDMSTKVEPSLQLRIFNRFLGTAGFYLDIVMVDTEVADLIRKTVLKRETSMFNPTAST